VRAGIDSSGEVAETTPRQRALCATRRLAVFAEHHGDARQTERCVVENQAEDPLRAMRLDNDSIWLRSNGLTNGWPVAASERSAAASVADRFRPKLIARSRIFSSSALPIHVNRWSRSAHRRSP
jgi:hypothetical protein